MKLRLSAVSLVLSVSGALLSGCGGAGMPVPVHDVVTKLDTTTELASSGVVKQGSAALSKEYLTTTTAYTLDHKLGASSAQKIKVLGAHLEPQVVGMHLNFIADAEHKSCLIGNKEDGFTESTLAENDNCMLDIEASYDGDITQLDKNLMLIIEVEGLEDKQIPFSASMISQKDVVKSDKIASLTVQKTVIHSDGALDIVIKNNSDKIVNRVVVDIASSIDSHWFFELLDNESKAKLNEHQQIVLTDKNLASGENEVISLKLDASALKSLLEHEYYRHEITQNIITGKLVRVDASNTQAYNIDLAVDFKSLRAEGSQISIDAPEYNYYISQ